MTVSKKLFYEVLAERIGWAYQELDRGRRLAPTHVDRLKFDLEILSASAMPSEAAAAIANRFESLAELVGEARETRHLHVLAEMTLQELREREDPPAPLYARSLVTLLGIYGDKVEAGEMNRDAHRVDALLQVIEHQGSLAREDAAIFAEKLESLAGEFAKKRPVKDPLNLAGRAAALATICRNASGLSSNFTSIVPDAAQPEM